jgi:predicted nucleotide-binding protein
MATRRNKSSKKETSKKEKQEIFIGSSSESIKIAQALELNLKNAFKITLWPMGVFEPGSNPLQDLEKQLSRTAFGIFVFAKDDYSFVRGTRYYAARDNVVFELGLFLGKLGRENCFVVAPQDRRKMKIPSDLEGFSLVSYDQVRLEENARAALSPACSEIQAAIEKRLKAIEDQQESMSTGSTSLSTNALDQVSQTQGNELLGRHVIDLLGMLGRGQAGLEVTITDESRLHTWSLHLMKMALQELRNRMTNCPEDAYIVWLKPTKEEPELLKLFGGENLPPNYSNHHNYAAGEGLAGYVWSTGHAEVHSSSQENAKWVIRAGCENVSYVCVPVGKPGGSGGVLAFGSNSGFQVHPLQTEVMTVYASFFALGSN